MLLTQFWLSIFFKALRSDKVLGKLQLNKEFDSSAAQLVMIIFIFEANFIFKVIPIFNVILICRFIFIFRLSFYGNHHNFCGNLYMFGFLSNFRLSYS